jgi:cell division protein FtsB
VLNRAFASLLIVLAPIGGAGAQRSQATGTNADVPVTKVVLFSSGVGYFEHAGTVHGNGSTALRFKTSQINDILKSLVLQDQDGGRVGAITYASQDPLVKTLRSFQVDITQNPSLANLLNQLRGAHVSIQVHAEKMSGTILGVEVRRIPADKGEPIAVPVLNLLAGATIRAVELQSISNLSLDDPELEAELAKALSSLAQARDQDRKPVQIDFTGAGARRVRIGYVVETPIWKTSYRLLLDDRKTVGQLQAWAIVENQTESDWNGVSLSLVSGRPISFMMDLYQPLYSTRPTVVPELFASLRPQVYEGGMATDSARVAMAPAMERRQDASRLMGKAGGYANQLSQVVVTGTMDAVSSVQAIASAMKLGELFQYVIGNVTLARQKSAMLPIITDSIELERVSIYNASVLQSNPLNGVRLKNTTGKHLLQGPVTVFDKGGYAGDARVDNVPPGQERLLSYGIDLDMTVDNTRQTQTNAVQTASISRGTLFIKRKLVSSQEYAADNKSNRDKMLVIEHPIRTGWKLVSTQAPMETTPTLYRFKGTAAAHKVTTLVVREEWVQGETVAMLPADLNQLLVYSTTSEIPKDVRDAIARAIQLKQGVFDVERQIATRTQQIAEITAEQNRLRENMKTVAQQTPYYVRLLGKLNEQETSIEGLQKERDQLSAQRDVLRRELADYLGGLKVG